MYVKARDCNIAQTGGPGTWDAFVFVYFLSPVPYHSVHLWFVAKFQGLILAPMVALSVKLPIYVTYAAVY